MKTENGLKPVGQKPEQWLTMDQVADRWKCHTMSIRRMIRRKDVPLIWAQLPFKRGGLRIRTDSVEKFEKEIEMKAFKRFHPLIKARA